MSLIISNKERIPKANGEFLIVGTNDPNGIPKTVTISYSNFFKDISVVASFSNTVSFATATTENLTVDNLVLSYKHTPINSVETTVMGRMYFDDNYVYVATANNNIKRIPLEAF